MRLSGLISAAVLLWVSLPAYAEVLPAPRQVGANSWVWIGPYSGPAKENHGFRMNLGFVVGKEAVAVVDTGYGPDMAEAMIVHIRKITSLPIRYAINTNSQPHRFMGNPVFRRHGAQIVAADDAVQRMLDSGAQFAETISEILELPPGRVTAPKAPDMRLTEPLSLDLGEVRLGVIPVGSAHTRGSLVVRVDPDEVVFAGDVLYGGRLLAVLADSSVAGWIEAYDELRRFRDATFVPGHGDPAPLSEFEFPTYRYLTNLLAHMDRAAADFVELREAIDGFDQSPWQQLANFETLSGPNAHQAYLEREMAGL